jgi:hypothetical protein
MFRTDSPDSKKGKGYRLIIKEAGDGPLFFLKAE